MLFSFFAMFLPTMLTYALEIRMYSWTAVFVTLMAIYMYRFIKQKDLKNLVLFGIFSILSCYMHYYALACAGLLNLGLIIYVIRKKDEFGKNMLTKFIIVEVLQVLLYLPWFVCFVKQALRVGTGFWITIEFPQILIDILNFQFKASLQELVPTIFASLLYIYLIYLIIKNIKKKEDIKVAIIPIAIYIIIIIVMALVSRISAILYARYLFTITGLLIFAISYLLAKENNKFIIGIICGAITIMSLMNLVNIKEENYDKSNGEIVSFLKENVQENDIIVYSDMGNGGISAVFLNETEQYFINLGNWSIEDAYKAYAPQMGVKATLGGAIDEAKGRIIIVDTADSTLYNQIKDNEEYETILTQKIEAKYHNYVFNVAIIEKNN